jgi:hypothetical protein
MGARITWDGASEHRHCERSEAIQLARAGHSGLLRCARNDGSAIMLNIVSTRLRTGFA